MRACVRACLYAAGVCMRAWAGVCALRETLSALTRYGQLPWSAKDLFAFDETLYALTPHPRLALALRCSVRVDPVREETKCWVSMWGNVGLVGSGAAS
jgi:hypothetical protein